MTKRFIVESVMIDCLCEDEPRIAKVITDTDEDYIYEELYEVAELLNEQQNIINILLDCLYVAEDTVIHEYSSHIGEDMEKLEKIFKDRDIGEIRKFVLGADEDE